MGSRERNASEAAPLLLRCAIYTRKSTEEGLDQEFNSLDAQREAAEAFIRSQRREGWIALPQLYDDGGFTGANMDRPALAAGFEVRCQIIWAKNTFAWGFGRYKFQHEPMFCCHSQSRGLDGDIEIDPGARILLVPQHLLKAYADFQVTSKFAIDLSFDAVSSSYARGNENNQRKPDGIYYLGPGTSPGYGVLNLGGRYQIRRWIQVFGQINNLLDHHYYSGAQLGSTGFAANGNFIARPFPAVSGAFPIVHATFYAPGAPISAWGGLRFRF
jgi:hypothetical protein